MRRVGTWEPLVEFAEKREIQIKEDFKVMKSKKKGSQALNGLGRLTCSINYDNVKDGKWEYQFSSKGVKRIKWLLSHTNEDHVIECPRFMGLEEALGFQRCY